MHYYLLLYFLILTYGCKNDTTKLSKVQVTCQELDFPQNGFVQLSDTKEPGDKLTIYGKVLDASTNQPIANANLFLYQAGTDGNYSSTFLGMPSYARIRGKTKTGPEGCFKIQTVMPGNYPGQLDGKHIHVEVKARGYEKWNFEFLFEGFVSESLRVEINQNNDAIILQVDQKKEGSWLVATQIPLKSKGRQ